jgi:GTPase SAR1 family protein
LVDITEEKSFESITKWLEEIDAFAGPNVVKLLVGNKVAPPSCPPLHLPTCLQCDLEAERVVPTSKGEALAKSLGISFIETSAVCLSLSHTVLHSTRSRKRPRTSKKPFSG